MTCQFPGWIWNKSDLFCVAKGKGSSFWETIRFVAYCLQFLILYFVSLMVLLCKPFAAFSRVFRQLNLKQMIIFPEWLEAITMLTKSSAWRENISFESNKDNFPFYLRFGFFGFLRRLALTARRRESKKTNSKILIVKTKYLRNFSFQSLPVPVSRQTYKEHWMSWRIQYLW